MNSTVRPTKKICMIGDKVDERLERIRENIWPSDPYLMDLVAPTSYHLPPHLANNWRRTCPFDKNEEQLQYMTFLPHTGRGDTMLRTTGDWDDGNGSLKPRSAKRKSGDSSSGAISPLPGQPPRKKISLLDYNRKKAGQTGGKTTPKATKAESPANGELQVAEATVKPTVKVSEPVKEALPEIARGHKRSADEMTHGQSSKAVAPPKVSTAPKTVQNKVTRPQAAVSVPAKPVGMRGLPRMLSPTLPACIEERLAKLHAQPAKAEPAKAEPAKAEPESHATPKPRINGSVTTINRKSVTMHDVTSDNPKATTRIQDSKTPTSFPNQGTAAAHKAITTSATATRVPAESDSGPKQHSKISSTHQLEGRHVQNTERRPVVVLRIPKRLRKDCQRILQLQPRPRKSALKTQPADSLGHDNLQTLTHKALNSDSGRKINGSTPQTANGLVAPRSGESMADADKEPPSKRQKPSDTNLVRPQTPGHAQHNTGHRSQLSTPKADRKSAAMDRIKSSEGEVKTPMGSMRSSTPVIPGSTGTESSSSRQGRSSSNVSVTSVAALAKRDEEASVYKTEFTKYADIAKSLKREADGLTKTPGGDINPDSTIRRQGLAKGIETAICYMLAFTLKDESSRIKKILCDRAPWISLLPYFNFLKHITRNTESLQLQGLVHQLEAVCRDTIHRCDLERLEREKVAEENLIKQVAESGRQARQAWIEGRKLLTLDDLGQCFPETWAQRSKSPDESMGNILPNHYHGSYYLPLSNISTNIETIRAGWCFLKEWCKGEMVEWNGKIGL